MNTKNSSNAAQDGDGWVPFASFDPPQMAHRDIGIESQSFLAKAAFAAQPFDVAPDDPLPVHQR